MRQTRHPPNAPDQRPAFADQTRALLIKNNIPLNSQTVADGLVHPWGMAQLPDGSWLVTERPRRVTEWQGDLLIGGLASQALIRLTKHPKSWFIRG